MVNGHKTGARFDIRQARNTRQYRKLRRVFLNDRPLCVDCEKEGRTVLADHLDHKKPAAHDEGLFWDIDNWQGLCVEHHEAKTAKERGPSYPGRKEWDQRLREWD